jgi:hypothetical protein
MPIVIKAREKMSMPKSKSQAFEDYKKKKGYRHKADPKHAMNRERTGPSTLKEDPVYKKSGGKIYNCR